MKNSATVLLLTLCLASPAFAQKAYADEVQTCDRQVIIAVARWAAIEGKLTSMADDGGLIAAAACKVMPNAPQSTIAAVAFDANHGKPNSDTGRWTQVVALVESGKVVAANRSIIEEDTLTGVGANSYRIDVAPYRLSSEVRAFGVVFTSSGRGPSCPDASAEEELTLWVREGDSLRPVFGTNLRGWYVIEGCGCSMCNGDSRSASADMTIGVEKTASHGFADLSITAHITLEQRKAGGESSETGKRTARTVLHYDGKSYGVDMFRRFW
jgi:hypothetical protein